MSAEMPYGQGTRMLTLAELCQWLNITERHARKLVQRGAIPYRKVGHLLRFPEREVDLWSRPQPSAAALRPVRASVRVSATPGRPRARVVLPKSLIEWPPEQENNHGSQRSA
jgi:excisionase family DNA binding protein